MDIYLPTHEYIEAIHEDVINAFGGRHGVLHRDALKSVIERAKLYIQLQDCNLHKVCAVIMHSVAQNHPFTDANKRTALITVLLIYNVNGVVLEYANEELNGVAATLLLWIVEEKPTIDEIAEQLQAIVETYAISGIENAIEKIINLFEVAGL